MKGGKTMSSLGNKEVMAENLQFYLSRSGKSQKELSEILGVSPSAFNDWIKAKKYPRIDKIEMLASIFGILKSDLIEKRNPERESMQKKNDTLTDIILRMRTDDEFLSVCETLHKLDSEKLRRVGAMLNAFVE
jgi:transcriptional regulator with XRE-family HTH domain